jgi:hypothetical protein
MLKPAKILAVVLSVTLVCINGCDNDKPTGPTEPKDYYVYLCDQFKPDFYFRYHIGIGEYDSIPAPYSTLRSGYCISPDGKTMYISPADYGCIAELSLDSSIVVAEHPIDLNQGSSGGWRRRVAISPNSHYLAIVDQFLHIYDTRNFNLIYSDTIDRFLHGEFSQGGGFFFCAGHDIDYTDFYVLKIDLARGLVETRWDFPQGAIYNVLCNVSINKLFMYTRIYRDMFLFQVYDISMDSIIYTKSFCPGHGHMVITPNNRYIIYSQPGTIISDCVAPEYFTVYDFVRNRIDREVDAFVDTLGLVYPTDDLYVTPDGRHLIGISNLNGLFDYDIELGIFNEHSALGGARMTFSLEGQ